MTYQADETAGESPIELFRFYKGGTVFAYTSGDEEISFDGDVYVPAVISRSEASQTNEIASDELTVECERDLGSVAWFIARAPEVPVWLTIYRVHTGDLVAAAEIWYGEVAECKLEDAMASMTVYRLEHAMQQPIPRMVWQAQCNHVLYDAQCKVDMNAYKASGFVAGLSVDTLGRQVITVSFNGDSTTDYYTAGFIIHGNERGYVEKHDNGFDMHMMVPMAVNLSDAINIFAGCDHVCTTCKLKFNNSDNYGGFEYVPQTSPFKTLV